MSGTAFNQRSKVTVLPITSAVPNEGLRAKELIQNPLRLWMLCQNYLMNP
ncbi:MAG: hypothetical protein ACM65M_02990 [Microcoleus sp.]